MKISALLSAGRPTFSFEFFPPKKQEDYPALYTALEHLKQLGPDFVSVTHPANGQMPFKTAELAARIKNDFGLEPMAHLTCIAHSRQEISDVVAQLEKLGIQNILAMRGDLPKDMTLDPEKAHYSYANELVADIVKLGDFCIGVAGYPAVHPQAQSAGADIINLKRKVDAGADFIITQLFFDNRSYFSFLEKCRAAGITVPVIAGIMPITEYKQLQRFTQMCSASVPQDFADKLRTAQDDSRAVAALGVEFATAQCAELLRRGAPGVHFFTLNKSDATSRILKNLKNSGF